MAKGNRGAVSAVIYTKDNPEKVIKLVEHIHTSIDEIVIIDSSSHENFNTLSQNIGKIAKLYNIPALGVVEPFQNLGAQLAQNDWILHLDDDEIPSPELLQNLRTDDDVACYILPRLEKFREFKGYHPRLYHKHRMLFSGIIHWGLIPTERVMRLEYTLYHYEKPSYMKWKIYAALDAYFYGYKILWIANNKKWHPFSSRTKIAEILGALVLNKYFLGKKIGWFLAVNIYLSSTTFYALTKGSIRARIMKILRNLIILFHIGKDFGIKVALWESLYAHGTLNRYLGLNTLGDFKKLRERNKRGLDLLISLIEEKAGMQDERR